MNKYYHVVVLFFKILDGYSCVIEQLDLQTAFESTVEKVGSPVTKCFNMEPVHFLYVTTSVTSLKKVFRLPLFTTLLYGHFPSW